MLYASILSKSPLKGKQWLTLFWENLGKLGLAPNPNDGINLSES